MAITYGMSAKEFWEEEPDLFWAYRFSYYEKLKINKEIFNHNAWLQGTYFCEAVGVALNNSFSKNKVNYPEKPYNLDKQEVVQDEKKSKQDLLVTSIKERAKQIQAIMGKNTSSTLPKGENKTKGGDEMNE